jgi:hypothetical protein
MNVIVGLIFIGLIALILVGWVGTLGRLGVMLIGITICIPALMGCVLNLHGRQRWWAIAPGVAFLVLSVLVFREWNRVMRK